METPLTKQQRQEKEYAFPYHFIPRLRDGRFSQAIFLRWGYEYTSYLNFVLSQLERTSFQSMLDVGCGDGRLVYEAQHRFHGREIVGVDFSERAIALARAMNSGGDYRVGDITNPALFDRQFDVITLVEVLEHIPLQELGTFVSGIEQHLKAGGTLIITVPSKNIRTNPKHFQHFDEDSLRSTLQPLFTVQECYFINSTSTLTRVLERIMTNRFYILKQRHLMNALYRMYMHRQFQANSETCGRLCVRCIKDVDPTRRST